MVNYFIKINYGTIGSNLSKKQVMNLNKAPYQLLIDNKYHNSQVSNKNVISSCRGNNIVDSVWYKNIENIDTYILNLYNEQGKCINIDMCKYNKSYIISDHNPIISNIIK